MKSSTPNLLPAQPKKSSRSFFGQVTGQGVDSEHMAPTFFGPAPFIQAKLTIGAPDDPYEREADAVAEQVVQRMSAPASEMEEKEQIQPKIQRLPLTVQRKCAACEEEEKVQKKEEEKPEDLQGGIQRKPIFESNGDEEPPPGVQPAAPMVQRKCAACEKEESKTLQRKPSGGGEMTASADVASRISHSKGGGTPLPESVQNSMGGALGADLSGVRVHTDSQAVQLNRDLGAQAFTHGSDVYFGAGKFQPGTGDGDRLLAHELVHVGQQGGNQRIQRDLFSRAEVSYSIDQQTSNILNPNIYGSNLEEAVATRRRLLEAQSQIIADHPTDPSLWVSSPISTTGGFSFEEQQLNYQKYLGFSSGLEVIRLILNQTADAIRREQSDWYVFSDRTYTFPVVVDIAEKSIDFITSAVDFLNQNPRLDSAIDVEIRDDLAQCLRAMGQLLEVMPAPIGSAEATGRRFLGGVTGALGNVGGFLRLGLWDSWAQSFSNGSAERINQAQNGMSNLMMDISENGFFATLGDRTAELGEEIEQAENLEHFNSSGQTFGNAAMNVYFVGRGVVSGAQGLIQINRAASALRQMGNAAPWRSAVRLSISEMITFRGVGLYRGTGFWGNQRGLAGMGETIEVNRVINQGEDLVARHWRANGGQSALPPDEMGNPPSAQSVARQHMSSSTGSPYQSSFPMGDIETYALANPQNIGVISQGGTVVTIRVPARGVLSANQLALEGSGINPEVLSPTEANVLGARAPSNLRPATAEGYQVMQHPPEVGEWIERNLGVQSPNVRQVLDSQGVPYYEWEQLIMAPDLRPYVTGSAPNPFASSQAAPPVSIIGARPPIYHPALNPQSVYGLATSQAGGWQSFASYMRWLRGGAGANLGFSGTEITGFERFTLLGGGPLSTPYLPPVVPRQITPELSESSMRGYLGWISQQSVNNPLIQTGENGTMNQRGFNPVAQEQTEFSNATAQIANIATRIRESGGAILSLRAGPQSIYLKANIAADLRMLSLIMNMISGVWTVSSDSIQVGIELVISQETMEQGSLFQLIEILRTSTPPSNINIQISAG